MLVTKGFRSHFLRLYFAIYISCGKQKKINPTLDINILKFENWQSLVPGLVCDLPRCVERPLYNGLKYEFLRGIIAYKQLRMLMLQKKKNYFLFSIFY